MSENTSAISLITYFEEQYLDILIMVKRILWFETLWVGNIALRPTSFEVIGTSKQDTNSTVRPHKQYSIIAGSHTILHTRSAAAFSKQGAQLRGSPFHGRFLLCYFSVLAFGWSWFSLLEDCERFCSACTAIFPFRIVSEESLFCYAIIDQHNRSWDLFV